MNDIISRLDKIASLLEASGRIDSARYLDVVANTFERNALLGGAYSALKKKVFSMMPKEKAVKLLKAVPGWKEKLPEMIKEIRRELNMPATGNSKEAGIADTLKNPLKLAVLALMLYAGSANAGAVEDLVEILPTPSSAEMSALETGLAPLWMFKGQFKSMVEDALDNDAAVGKYVREHMTGRSKDEVHKILTEAFFKKLEKKPEMKKSLENYLQGKDVKDTTSYLGKLIQQEVLEGL